MTQNETVFSKDLQQKKLYVTRSFNAPLDQVWQAWTDAAILDQWWAPRPYRAVTKSMDFREGGYWLYCMMGPAGEQTWCRVNWDTITEGKHISYRNMFCDEAGTPNPDFPPMYWQQDFKAEQDRTTVSIEIRFDRVEDMEMIIGMGFQEGFTAGLGNLDQYLLKA